MLREWLSALFDVRCEAFASHYKDSDFKCNIKQIQQCNFNID